ncbi:conserved protein of unknown function [Candidatus Filomicrobium marinum]|uniref:DUF4167 domain-containing protein n=2 Tax=Filomicrobium TaxID=119044 RepID=A0A0D6JCV3_9HYPH|nr:MULTISPECIES: DUF4167 domain-containing protein [Filomicrobium]CFX12471.1 conserved protein of unknown function [Candidatus Filomicrobium marinum]CPR17449.1 conserved protein of unknown function [Candidatus Filomicrobium marinum]SDO33917.1 protein of unknown function [Filomicrobium insigne]
MRQGQQQNRRGRGRNRKGQSPLTRSFESNGPDVKIRGTPAHIAEKYMALARDSMSSGDPVLAENYLQHAEHYNRIIMAFREQQSPNANDVVNGNNRFRSPVPDQYDNDDVGDEDGEDNPVEANQQAVVQPNDPQPAIAGVTRNERPERAERSERTGEQRPQRDRRNGSNGPRQRSDRSDREPRRRERQRFGESGDQPDFLRRPVRRTRREDTADDAETTAAAPPAETVAAVEESQE